MNRISKLILSATALVLLATPAAAGSLVIDVKGVRSNAGKILIAVHMAKDGVRFPDGAGVYTATSRFARTGSQRITFSDLPKGRFAVSAFHDENGNGKLDMNRQGIPTEGYGFSNDATVMMGPPSFEDAAVAVGDGEASTTLTFSY